MFDILFLVAYFRLKCIIETSKLTTLSVKSAFCPGPKYNGSSSCSRKIYGLKCPKFVFLFCKFSFELKTSKLFRQYYHHHRKNLCGIMILQKNRLFFLLFKNHVAVSCLSLHAHSYSLACDCGCAFFFLVKSRWQRLHAPLFFMVMPGASVGQTVAYGNALREGHLWHVSIP